MNATHDLSVIFKAKDYLSGKVGKIQTRFTALEGEVAASISKIDNFEKATMGLTVAGGVMMAGAGAVAVGMNNIADSALPITARIGELDSLGEQSSAALSQYARDLSNQWGESRDIVLGATYNIESALGNTNDLTQEGVQALMESSTKLAKATKGTIDDATLSLIPLTGKYKDAIGDVQKTSEMAAESVAYTVKNFRTTGPQMAQAFEPTIAMASSLGVEMSQLTVTLGAMQEALPGSQAGTAMAAFLKSMIARGSELEKLGVQVQDSTGKFLQPLEVLQADNTLGFLLVLRISPHLDAQ